MSKHFDNGNADDAAERERPPLTHRVVEPAEVAAEQASVPQNALAPGGDADTHEDTGEPQEGSQKKARRRSVKK